MIDFIAVVQTMLDIYHSVKSPSAELLAPFNRIGKTDYAERFRIFTHQKKKKQPKKSVRIFKEYREQLAYCCKAGANISGPPSSCMRNCRVIY